MRWLNLALLFLYPVSWFAPLLRAGILPFFGLTEISVVSGLQSLWDADVFLALVVTMFALFAPILKTIGLALVQFKLLDRKTMPIVNLLGKFAMADIFLIALYITLSKGMGLGTIETAWGLYLFTACILGSVMLGALESGKPIRPPQPAA